MQIVIFTHPGFLGSQSMPRFATFLENGLKKLGHEVELWSPQPKFYNLPVPSSLKKWAGYTDQYLLFPAWVRKRLKSTDKNILFVFADQALGPWVPLVSDKPHVIHCHDFLAQRSALGEIPENPTSSTGKKYQEYIRKGYQQGENFISVSKRTQEDLHRFLKRKPAVSEVVYNGLNQNFKLSDVNEARNYVSSETGINLSNGYILHIGGNQWYKNRPGVINIYNTWRKHYNSNLPLILIGANPNQKLTENYLSSPFKADIHLLTGKTDQFVQKAYNGASVFLFPSLAEGFGWPIAEAMASGCPVITTNEAPMTEVGGIAAQYIPKMPQGNDAIETWAKQSAEILNEVLNLSQTERDHLIEKGIANAKRFDAEEALKQIEKIYKQVMLQTTA